jgi:hypothetical protein
LEFITVLHQKDPPEYHDDPLTNGEIATFNEIRRTKYSAETPLHDSIVGEGSDFAASADFFSVSAWGNARLPDGRGESSASFRMRFSPLSDAFTNIGLSFVGEHEFWWSEALVSLRDMTTNEELWKYGWVMDEIMTGNLPWNANSGTPDSISLSVPTSLLASHDYFLTMYTGIGTDGDSERMTIRLSGLSTGRPDPAPVPESSTMLLVPIAIGALLGWRRTLV